MKVTPLDLRQQRFNTVMRGYDRGEVTAFLNEGKLPEAVGMFEKYLSIAPTGQFAAQAKAMVAQLKK